MKQPNDGNLEQEEYKYLELVTRVSFNLLWNFATEKIVQISLLPQMRTFMLSRNKPKLYQVK